MAKKASAPDSSRRPTLFFPEQKLYAHVIRCWSVFIRRRSGEHRSERRTRKKIKSVLTRILVRCDVSCSALIDSEFFVDISS